MAAMGAVIPVLMKVAALGARVGAVGASVVGALGAGVSSYTAKVGLNTMILKYVSY